CALALWPWTRWGLGLERLAAPLARRRAAAPSPAAPPAWETWPLEAYRAGLQARWAGLGVHQVLGARRRNRSLPPAPPRGGEGGQVG
ncbi:MAG: hypothetical protein ACOZHQ_13780, partial [Thermodesulfobacteriota bacterium]